MIQLTGMWDAGGLRERLGTSGANVVDEATQQQINGVLQAWRQGDCVLGEHWFLFRLLVERPLTATAAAAAAEGADAAEDEVRGLMIATQTCDIVRDCMDRPFAEVCPLVEVDPDRLEECRKGRRPRFAFVPGVADRFLVADLDRVMTVEKALLAGWEREAGCRNDHESRALSLSLARKRVRTAFPDDFTALASPMESRLRDKHGKNSDEGRALRALREIRVRAAPSWDAEEIHLTWWFIRNENEPEFEQKEWSGYLEDWMKEIRPMGRFVSVIGLVETLDDLTARDYVESDPLDLDSLSRRAGSG